MTNEAFIWADELVSEFINWRSGLSKPILDRISVFKESKQPKQTLANEELEDKWVKANATFDGKKMNETNFKIASEQPKSQPIKSNIEHLYPKVEKVELKQPTKLFTTEDGKDIFEGDTFYVVTMPHFGLQQALAPAFTKKPENYKRFSNKDNASDFILLNKTTLKLNEVMDAVYVGGTYGEIVVKLKELAKQKLNKQ